MDKLLILIDWSACEYLSLDMIDYRNKRIAKLIRYNKERVRWIQNLQDMLTKQYPT